MGNVHDYLSMAIALARENVEQRRGRPFGAVLVKDDQVIATGVNTMLATHDPTAHAEMEAIRTAAIGRQSSRLDGAVMYASGQPCPMCLALMHMTGISEIYYAYSNEDGAPFGLSTTWVYAEMAKPLGEHRIAITHVPLHEATESLYALWQRLTTP